MPFNDGIAEDYLSTRWFVKRYRELTGRIVQDAKELADAHSHDAAAQLIFREFSQNLATFLDSFIRQREPEVLVIGGNMAKAAPLFLDRTTQALSPVAQRTGIRLATLGETAALIGGAGCWKEEYALTD
jgi:glucokinase